jgi:hypothetical protein
MSNFVHKSSPVKENQSSNLSYLFRNKGLNSKNTQGEPKASSLQDFHPKKKFSFKTILGIAVMLLLVIGGASAVMLTQLNQDVRQQASGCSYWDGSGAAPEGATDNRGGIEQECRGGLWSAPSGSGSGTSTGVASNESTAACGGGEIFCGGCINGCRPANATCNNQIDSECKQTGCGGNGTNPGAGESCCSGLQQCANGRCAPSCVLDNNDICGGIREGSNCNNGGSWTCDSTVNGGSGHCSGGVWNQPSQDRVSCNVAGNNVYYASQEICDSARAAVQIGQAIIGGAAALIEQVGSTVTSVRTSTHNVRCNLHGTIVYTTTDSSCTDATGTVETLVLNADEPLNFDDCSRDNRTAILAGIGSCEYGTNGWEFAEALPANFDDCSRGNSAAILAGEGSCEYGTNGWAFVEVEVLPANFDDCSRGNSTAILAGLGSCEYGIRGWVFVESEKAQVTNFDDCSRGNSTAILAGLGSCEYGTNGWAFVEVQADTHSECTSNNSGSIVAGLGTCRYVSNSWEFVEIEGPLVVSFDSCSRGNSESILAGEGACDYGDDGWEFVEIQSTINLIYDDCATANSGSILDGSGDCKYGTYGWAFVEVEEGGAAEALEAGTAVVIEGPLTLEEATGQEPSSFNWYNPTTWGIWSWLTGDNTDTSSNNGTLPGDTLPGSIDYDTCVSDCIEDGDRAPSWCRNNC